MIKEFLSHPWLYTTSGIGHLVLIGVVIAGLYLWIRNAPIRRMRKQTLAIQKQQAKAKTPGVLRGFVLGAEADVWRKP